MSKKFKLRDLEVVEGTICDAPMNPAAKVVLFKRRPARKESDVMSKKKTQKNLPTPEGADNTDPLKALQEKQGLTDEQLEAVRELVEQTRKQAEEAKAKAAQEVDEEDIGKQDGEDEDEEKEATRKSHPLSKAERRIAELEKALADERNRRLDREAMEKAQEFPAIPVKREKLASLIRAVGERLEKSYGDTLEQVLRACNQLAASNEAITKSLGQANGVDGGGRTAAEEIDEVAAQLMKADPKLSRSEAIGKAWASRPDLVQKARQENGGR